MDEFSGEFASTVSGRNLNQKITRYHMMVQQVNWLLGFLQPCEIAHERRQDIIIKITTLIWKSLGRRVFPCGSFPLKTYLAKGDLDLVLFCETNSNNDEISSSDLEIIKVASAFSEEALQQELKDPSPACLNIRNVNFINARTRIVTCVMGSLSLDVTVNQIGSLAAALLVEEANRKFDDDLIKRSILLLKAWGNYEAPKYAGVSMAVFGAKNSGLTSYALNIMILRLFTMNRSRLSSPIDVLMTFFREYGTFDWSHQCITLGGSVPVIQSADSEEPEHIFTHIVRQLQNKISNVKVNDLPEKRFQYRCCNIQDPLNSSNNVGYSVSLPVLRALGLALRKGGEHLDALFMGSGPLFPRKIQQGMAFCMGQPSIIPFAPQMSAISTRNAIHTQLVQVQNEYHSQQRESVKYLQHQQELALSHQSYRKTPPPQYSKSPILRATSENCSPIPSKNSELTNISVSPKSSAVQSSAGESDNIYNNEKEKCKVDEPPQWFLVAMFPHVMRECCSGDGFRHDLLEHPHQKWSPLQQGGTPKLVSLSGDLPQMWAGFNSALEILMPQLSRMGSRRSVDSSHSGVTEGDNSDIHQRYSPALSGDETSESFGLFNSNTSCETHLKVKENPALEMIDCSISCNIIPKARTLVDMSCQTENLNKKFKIKCVNTDSIAVTECSTQTEGRRKVIYPIGYKSKIPEPAVSKSVQLAAESNVLYRKKKDQKAELCDLPPQDIQGKESLSNSGEKQDKSHKKMHKIQINNVYIRRFRKQYMSRILFIGIFICCGLYGLYYSGGMNFSRIFGENDSISVVPHWVPKGSSISIGRTFHKFQDVDDTNLSFQWFKDGTLIPGAIRSFYSISEADISSEGKYTCLMYKSKKESIWAETLIRVSEPPVVSKHLIFQKLHIGDMLALHAKATGYPEPEYQWYLNGVPIQGATDSTFLKPNLKLDDMGTYSCSVYNVAGTALWEEALVTIADQS